MPETAVIDDAPYAEQATVAFPPLGAEVRALLVWPKFPPSFWGFEGLISLLPEESVLPPLGLLTLAALCPSSWSLRLVDCAFEELTDRDILDADLVLISAMYAQRSEAQRIAKSARALGRRTMLGGPYASSQPEEALDYADHVVVGEPDEEFAAIAKQLGDGTSQRLFAVSEKPGLADAPIPRFDLLQMKRYSSMSIQFSRGCPFQCEFCDIITLYGRRPRTKPPALVLAELDALYELGWRGMVFVVDDNFVGNHKRALELAEAISDWQDEHGRPFVFYTEASIDLAQRAPLMAAMARANFLFVFVGIESVSEASLTETKKYQNLRRDTLASIRDLQRGGLWVMGGFIVGFDSDTPGIFDRQRELIERAAIPWAMAGFLQAPPTTPLFDRMLAEGRLRLDSQATSNFNSPNFDTVLPRRLLLERFRRMLLELYDPESFYERAYHSLQVWRPAAHQTPPKPAWHYQFRVAAASMVRQGVFGRGRRAYWRFFTRLLYRWGKDPLRVWWGFTLLASGNHFTRYVQQVAAEIDAELQQLPASAVDHSTTATATAAQRP